MLPDRLKCRVSVEAIRVHDPCYATRAATVHPRPTVHKHVMALCSRRVDPRKHRAEALHDIFLVQIWRRPGV